MISNCFGFNPSMVAPASTGYTQKAPAGGAKHFEAEVEQQGVLKVTTADGDTVTISFGEADQMHANNSSATAGSAMTVNVTVNGSLDDKEVADISKLMRGLAKVTQDLQNGDTTKAAQDLLNTRSLQSVKAFQYAYQAEAQVSA